ncbi:MAG: hypothetical protein QNJ16_21310, partial [Rhodobacter sp.]|nr:hypothetical protein [Rhodobacter sp.]
TIDATNGDGLQFDDADGTYNFNGQVTLSGGDAGIDILGGSAGTFTFTNTDITNPTGIGLNIEDNAADVTFGAGSSITQTANDVLTIRAQNHMGGGLDFGGTINTTTGFGLSFRNADGTYIFDGTTTLSNKASVQVDGFGEFSDGTFSFGPNTAIDKNFAVLAAVDVAEFGGIFNFDGSIITDVNAEAIFVGDTQAGSVVNFNNSGGNTIVSNGPPGVSQEGIFLFNIDGTVNINTPTVLNNTDSGITVAGGTGTVNFLDTAVNVNDPNTDPIPVVVDGFDGTANFTNLNISVVGQQTYAFHGINSNTINVFGNSNIVSNGNTAVQLENVNAIDMTFNSINSSNATQFPPFPPALTEEPAPGLHFEDIGGGSFTAGTTTISSPDASGIDIIDSSGTFTFSTLTITDPGDTAIDIMGGDATVNVGAGNINNANDVSTVGVMNHTGNLNMGADISASNGDGLQFSNADGTYNFTGTTTLDGSGVGANTGIDILSDSAGTFTFGANTSIINPTNINDGSDLTGAAIDIQNLAAGGNVTYQGSVQADNRRLLNIRNTAVGSQINFTNPGSSLTSTDLNDQVIDIQDVDGDLTITTPINFVRPVFSAIFGTDGAGTWTFNDVTITNQKGTGNGAIDLFGNSGSINFMNLDITTDSAGTGDEVSGILAGGNNIFNVTGSNSIFADGGVAISMGTTNQINMTFENVTSQNNTSTQIGNGDDGISMFSIGGGSIEVTGTTTIENSGGVGIFLDGFAADATFNTLIIDGTDDQGIAAGTAASNTGTLTVGGGTINDTGNVAAMHFGDDSPTDTSGGTVMISNVRVTNSGGDTMSVQGTTLSGDGNVDASFSCNDEGGNTGTVIFNGGANTCP